MMSKLPDHWRLSTLDLLVDVLDYARIPLNKRERAQRDGPYPYYGANGQVGKVNDYIFDGDFVLIAEDGGHFDNPSRAVAYKASGRFWVNNHAHVVRPREGVDIDFLCLALRTVDWMQFVGGSTRLKLTQASLKQIPVPITSFQEQKRIARKLGSLLRQIEEANAELDDAERLLSTYKVAVLEAGVSGKKTKEWRADRGLPEWPVAFLGELASSFSYGSSAKSFKTGLVPVLRMGNIQNGELDWNDLAYTSDPNEIDRYRLARGDVLFNRTNSADLVGKTALYDDDRPAIYAGYLIKIAPGTDLVPAYLARLLNSTGAKQYFHSVKSDGVNQSNINAKKLAEFRFAVPSVAEQHEIARWIDTSYKWAEQMMLHVQKSKSLLSKLEIELVLKSFRGDLSASEEGDEKVETLLARLSIEADEENTPRLKFRDSTFVKAVEVKRLPNGNPSKTRAEIPADYLLGILSDMGGQASATELWRRSELLIDEFYKQLRDEFDRGLVVEAEKGRLVTVDAS